MADERTYPLTSDDGKPIYGLPHDDKELNRLDLQHEAVKIVFGDLNICKDQVDNVLDPLDGQRRVLDLGSGTGVWCIEMAEMYPHANILGVDIKLQEQSNLPPNCVFEIWDVNSGLERFYGQFDVVHTRFTTGVFANPQTALIEMERCLKPGGLLIIISASFLLSEDRKTMYPVYTKANPQGSWFQRSVMKNFPGLKKLGVDPQLFEREIDKGLWKHELLDPLSCAAALITVPIGPWPTSPDTKEAAQLRKVGEYWRDNFLIVHHHWERLHEASGRSRSEWELTVRKVDEELHETRHRVAIHMRAVWGRARGFNPSPSTVQRPLPLESSPGIFQVLSIHHSEDEWVRMGEEYRATFTPEMYSFLNIPNFDALL
ncbi:hypothetical protein PIIN_06672 [Serendipita indica DSM 11827]|uniref:Methyltransferase domain-containing protein n=1 Tax=Serendipita indica (strain DSM 11827) TaxID=1109443 RepID=G4TN43_SERID|nr:hypothetical protein PIIN_06672 [Serendipita indica DSM 11827]